MLIRDLARVVPVDIDIKPTSKSFRVAEWKDL